MSPAKLPTRARPSGRAPKGRERIRHLFGDRLNTIGVDCFTIYVQDLWSDDPDLMMPQEIDERLWYREPMRASPPPGYIRKLQTHIKKEGSATQFPLPDTSPIPLYSLFIPNAAAIGSQRHPDVHQHYPDTAALFQSFVEREAISATAVFMTGASVLHRLLPRYRNTPNNWIARTYIDPTRSEFLFFNFRTLQGFSPSLIATLQTLAGH